MSNTLKLKQVLENYLENDVFPSPEQQSAIDLDSAESEEEVLFCHIFKYGTEHLAHLIIDGEIPDVSTSEDGTDIFGKPEDFFNEDYRRSSVEQLTNLLGHFKQYVIDGCRDNYGALAEDFFAHIEKFSVKEGSTTIKLQKDSDGKYSVAPARDQAIDIGVIGQRSHTTGYSRIEEEKDGGISSTGSDGGSTVRQGGNP